jgi:hypothetical protein
MPDWGRGHFFLWFFNEKGGNSFGIPVQQSSLNMLDQGEDKGKV